MRVALRLGCRSYETEGGWPAIPIWCGDAKSALRVEPRESPETTERVPAVPEDLPVIAPHDEDGTRHQHSMKDVSDQH